MRIPQLHQFAAALTLLGLLVSGCQGQTEDLEATALREQYVLTIEPADAMTLTELARRLDASAENASEPAAEATPEAPAAGPVVVVGRIFAGDLEPWDQGKASFLLAELPAEGHGEGHDADNCPFCKRKAAQAPTAIVQFLDDSGQVIPRDARQLFGVEKKDVVTIRGEAVRGELNTLLITAEAIHVRGR